MQTYACDEGRKGFYHPRFKQLFDDRAREGGGRRKVTDLTEELCATVHVGPDTVKAWRYGRNAPGDLDTVAAIAEFFGVDVNTLLIEVKEEKMDKLEGKQLDAVSRVYKEIEDYAYLMDNIDMRFGENCKYRVKDGSMYAKYTTYWIDDPSEVRDFGFDGQYDLADRGQRWVSHALEREWVYLGSHPIYGELAEFIDETLWRLWDKEHDMEAAARDGRLIWPGLAIKDAREIIGKYL